MQYITRTYVYNAGHVTEEHVQHILGPFNNKYWKERREEVDTNDISLLNKERN